MTLYNIFLFTEPSCVLMAMTTHM